MRELGGLNTAFETDVKPFAKTLKEYFHMFDQGRHKEFTAMKEVFNQMETKVAQCSIDKKYLEIEKKELIIENDHLLEHIICQDVMSVIMHVDVESKNVLPLNNNSLEYDNLEVELLKKENDRLLELIISQDLMHTAVNTLPTIATHQNIEKSYLDEYNDNLELQAELSKRNDMNVPEFLALFEINDSKAQLEAKNNTISKLKDHIATLKGKSVSEGHKFENISKVIASGMYKLDLDPLSPKLLKNREAHVDYLKSTQKNVDILCEIIEQARALRPLDSDLDSTCQYVKRIQELLVYVSATCPNSSKQIISYTSASGSKPLGNTKKNRISKPTSSNKKNKVKDRLRSVKSSFNKKNHNSEPVYDANVIHFILNANFKLVCSTSNECMFDAIHDCVVDYLNNMNERAKSRSAKRNKKKNWKPSSKVFTSVGYRSSKSSSGTWTWAAPIT
ncbi:hypothetical protein Tco_1240520 [Tanacetum coccineum]